jgi:hypothetical protein
MLVLVALFQTTFPHFPGPAIPEGFSLVISAPGTALYRQEAPDGYPDFVQMVQLRQGAAIRLLHGTIVESGTGQGVYGGDNPVFSRQTLPAAWSTFAASNPDAFCVTNGQFFSGDKDRAKFTYPLKSEGRVVSEGHGSDMYADQSLMLEIWADRADIVALSQEALYASSAPDILGGLSPDAAGRHPNKPTGRTFVGVADHDEDGYDEVILIFTAKIARKTEAVQVLRRFGAEKVMMLDGGGSTQLHCQGEAYIRAGRTIPQTVAVVAARAATAPANILHNRCVAPCSKKPR